MPEPDDQIDDEGQKADELSEKSKAEEQIAKELGTINEHMQGDKKLLAELIADPMVREIIEAKTNGRTLKLVEDGAPSSGSLSDLSSKAGGDSGVDESASLEDLSRNDFAKVLMSKLTKVVSGVVSEGLAGVGDDVKALKGYVQGVENAKVKKQLTKLKSDHKDFDELKDQMRELSKQSPGLSLKQLYLLAKDETSDNVDVKVDSERPVSSSSRTKAKISRETPLAVGRAGLDTLLDESLAKLDLSELD